MTRDLNGQKIGRQQAKTQTAAQRETAKVRAKEAERKRDALNRAAVRPTVTGAPARHVDCMVGEWRVTVHDSFISRGMLLVQAVHPSKPPLSEEVRHLPAAREWVRSNLNPGRRP